MASLPTSLHFLSERDAAGVTALTSCKNREIYIQGFGTPLPPNPYSLRIPKFARRALRPPLMVCIVRICPGIFSVGPGSGLGHTSQVNHQKMAASQAGSRGEVKGEVGSCGR